MDHENLNLSSGIYETRSSKLTDGNAKCRVEFETSYNYLRLVAACSKIARTSVKVRKTKLLSLVLLRAQKRNLRAISALTTRRFTSLIRTENERYYTACKCLFDQLSILAELKLLIINRDSSIVVSCRSFTS